MKNVTVQLLLLLVSAVVCLAQSSPSVPFVPLNSGAKTDAESNTYIKVVDPRSNKVYIQRFDANGAASAKFILPSGRSTLDFAPAPYGEVDVLAGPATRRDKYGIVRFGSDGSVLGELPMELSNPQSIAVFPSGELLVVGMKPDGPGRMITVFSVFNGNGELIRETEDPERPGVPRAIGFSVIGTDGNAYIVYGVGRPTFKVRIHAVNSNGEPVSHCVVADGPLEIDSPSSLWGVQVGNGKALLNWGKVLYVVDTVTGATLNKVAKPPLHIVVRFDGYTALLMEAVSAERVKLRSIPLN